jgi:hypothetical protein
MTSPRLPLVKAQRLFLSGIRLSTQLHGHKVEVTVPPIKNGSSELSGCHLKKTEVRNSRGFSFEVRKILLRFKQFKLSRSFNVVWIYQNRNFSYPKLLSFSVLTFIKWRLNTELLANTLRNVVFFDIKKLTRFIISLQANNLTSLSSYATDLTSDR